MELFFEKTVWLSDAVLPPGQSVAAFNQRLGSPVIAVSSDLGPRSTAGGAHVLLRMETPKMGRFDISQFWLEARKCFDRPQWADDRAEKLRWLTVAVPSQL